jgi:uncharacterized membrane protein YgdD (TMEM256/DUF423 family)
MSMNKHFWIKIIAVSGFLSVVLGAFSAHGLEAVLSDRRMQNFQTAVHYQVFHTLALLGIVCIEDRFLRPSYTAYSAYCFLLGIILFSGSLYLLAITDIVLLGMITPVGGSALIIGWIMLFLAVTRSE